LSVQATENGRWVEVILPFLVTGTWKLNGNKYVATTTDIKTQYNVLLKEEGQPDINLSNLHLPPHLRLKLEDLIPRGASQEWEIVELTPSTLKLRGKDLKGIEFFYEGVRQ
jgi:hypothetical protein